MNQKANKEALLMKLIELRKEDSTKYSRACLECGFFAVPTGNSFRLMPLTKTSREMFERRTGRFVSRCSPTGLRFKKRLK